MERKALMAIVIVSLIMGLFPLSVSSVIQAEDGTIQPQNDLRPSYGIGQLLATFPVDLNQCWERNTGSSDLLYNPCGNPKGPRKSVGELWPILSATFEFCLPSEGWILLDVEWILDANYPGSFYYEVDKFDENSGQWSKVGVPRVYSEKKDGQYVRAPVPSNFWDGFQIDSNGNLSGPIDMGRPMPSGKYRIVASEYFYDTTPVYYTQAYWASKGTINVIFVPIRRTECNILKSKLEKQKKELENYKKILEDQENSLKKIEQDITNIMLQKAGVSIGWDPTSDSDWQIVNKRIPIGPSVIELYDSTVRWNRLSKTKERLIKNIGVTEDYIRNLEVQISNTERDLNLCYEGTGDGGKERRSVE